MFPFPGFFKKFLKPDKEVIRFGNPRAGAEVIDIASHGRHGKIIFLHPKGTSEKKTAPSPGSTVFAGTSLDRRGCPDYAFPVGLFKGKFEGHAYIIIIEGLDNKTVRGHPFRPFEIFIS